MKLTNFQISAIIGVIAVALYALLAIYFDLTYRDPRPPGRVVTILPKPFETAGAGYFVKYAIKADPRIVLYEDQRPLDPLGDDDTDRGPARFRFTKNGIIFSSSDGTDPNNSEHHYWLVIK